MNQTAADVTGNCSLQGGKAQELKITFNSNWTLTLTFALLTDSVSSMLGGAEDDYSLRDIVFVYDLRKEFFPNASKPSKRRFLFSLFFLFLSSCVCVMVSLFPPCHLPFCLAPAPPPPSLTLSLSLSWCWNLIAG